MTSGNPLIILPEWSDSEGSIRAAQVLTPGHQVTLGGPNKGLRRPGWGLVIGCGDGGEGYECFPSGYVLLERNLMGLVSCSDISGTLVRLRFVRLRFVRLRFA